MKRLLLLGVLLLVPLGFTTANADPPTQQGWWTTTNPGGLPLPSLSAGPDVPAKGLLVQGGGSAPVAYAALIYPLDQGAPATLTLQIAPNTITTPGSTLRVCPLSTATLNAEQGGPVAHAPKYDCARQTTTTPQGTTYPFNVSSLGATSVLAVAILPTKVTDRVVFERPDTDSLQLLSGAPLPGAATGRTASPAPAVTGEPAGFATAPSPIASPVAGLGPTPASAPASSPALATAPQSNAATARQSTAGFLPPRLSSGGAAKPWAVGAVLAGLLVAGGLWLFAGRNATRAAMEADAQGDG